MDGNNMELLLNSAKGVWWGTDQGAGGGPGSLCWLSCKAPRWKYQGPSRLRRLHTNHINWKLERGNGHNPHIYHPKGWSVHKFNPAKELENKMDAYKKSGTGKWGRGALSKQPLAARWLRELQHILFEAITDMKRQLLPGPWLKHYSFFMVFIK